MSARGWWDLAGCRGVDPELFFPVGTSGPALAQEMRAKAVCARCAVRAACLSFAVVAIPEGVAGGLSALERAQLRRAAAPVSSRGGSRRGRVPSGVDGLVVDRLVSGDAVVGASRDERAYAAVVMHRAGRRVGVIAARVGVDDRQVYRWLERAAAGLALNPGPAHRCVVRVRGVAS